MRKSMSVSLELSEEAKIKAVSSTRFSRFGWCAQDVRKIANTSPTFRQAIIEPTPRLFHLIGVLLALRVASPSSPALSGCELGNGLATLPAKELVRRHLGHCPPGLTGCLSKLPDKILRPKSYLALIELLDEPHVRKLLCHASRISGELIALLHRLYPELRQPKLISLLRIAKSVEVVEFLVNAILNTMPEVEYKAIIRSLAHVSSGPAMEKWFCAWMESATFPPAPWPGTTTIRPLQSASEIRQVGRWMNNCLGNRITSVIVRTRYYYLQTEAPSIVIELASDPLIGWCVNDMRACCNRLVPRPLMKDIIEEFRAGGILTLPSFRSVPQEIHPINWAMMDYRWLTP